VRNSRTACRNHSAPRLAATITPPRLATHSTPIRTASPSSTARVQRGSRLRRGASAPRSRCASTSKLANLTRHPLGAALGSATMARCRNRPNRSRNRAPSPLSHSRTVSLQTPNLAATAPRSTPSSDADTAANTTSTPVTLPGSASHGSTRSRCPHSSHRATAMLSTRNAYAACSLRPTRTFVSRTLAAAQRAQQQAASNCDTNELASASSYLLEWISST
jgi:hypothetical protein